MLRLEQQAGTDAPVPDETPVLNLPTSPHQRVSAEQTLDLVFDLVGKKTTTAAMLAVVTESIAVC
jgi:hypothetical protein